ncbi:MAG: NUDIX domain-containing protein [Defluviitaleaceae bacterium]|nr:NUDIX domain-containing protein [Defluviitaleaceae bacterium]
MQCTVSPFGSLQDYIYADVLAVHNGKWIFCKHKNRDTWEHPAGHIGPGETPQQAAERELYEESGATRFDLEPLCDYCVTSEFNGRGITGNGQVFFTIVHEIGDLPPHSEMEKVALFDALPSRLTYPNPTQAIVHIAQRKLQNSPK